MSFAQSLAQVLPRVPYGAPFTADVERARARAGMLAADELLAQCGAPGAYPPGDQAALVELCAQVERADPVCAARALFYLLAECSTPDADAAAYYASQTWMDAAEQSLVRALLTLDKGGRAAEAVPLLAEPCLEQGLAPLHACAFSAVRAQDAQLALELLVAVRASSEQLIDALARQGKFAEILALARQDGRPEYLAAAARAATTKPKALALAQLPCHDDEWAAVRAALAEAQGADAELAQRVLLARAVLLGDDATVKQLVGVNKYALMVADLGSR